MDSPAARADDDRMRLAVSGALVLSVTAAALEAEVVVVTAALVLALVATLQRARPLEL